MAYISEGLKTFTKSGNNKEMRHKYPNEENKPGTCLAALNNDGLYCTVKPVRVVIFLIL